MAAKKRIHCSLAFLLSVLMLLSNVIGVEAQRGQRRGGGGPGDSPFTIAVGARVGLDFTNEVWSAGGQLRFALPFLPGLEMLPNGDVFLGEEQNEWQINLDGALQVLPFAYGGGGFAIANDSLPTSSGPTIETGYNLFVGFNLPIVLPVMPFAEARWTTINRLVHPFRAVVGVNVTLGGSPNRRR